MNHWALHLYEQLQTDIALCRRKQLDPVAEAECCFLMAHRYLAILLQELQGTVFGSTEEEIGFFREIKPQFGSEREYYRLLFHAQRYFAESRHAEKRHFCNNESRRLSRFESTHKELCRYIQGGTREKDIDWFTRFPEGNGCGSQQDRLLSEWIALQRYDKFIAEEMGRKMERRW